MTHHIVVVSAGLSQPSSTRLLADRLVDAVQARLGETGEPALVEVVELRELARPLADRLVTGFAGEHLEQALRAVARADALIVVSPVFAGSYSGLFKTFFDVLDPEALRGTPVLLAATAGTARHSLVLEHALRPLFSYLRAWTLPTAVFAATDDFGAGGEAALGERVVRAGAELADVLERAAGSTGARERPAGEGAGADPDDPDDVFGEIVDFEQLLRGTGRG